MCCWHGHRQTVDGHADPDPELPPSAVAAAVQKLTMELQQAMMSGFVPTMEAAQDRLRQMRDELLPLVIEEARRRCERMETKMEDQLIEGGFLDALDQFITDMATFKTAFVMGPVLRRKPTMSWGENGELVVEDQIRLEWERIDPFHVFPRPGPSTSTTGRSSSSTDSAAWRSPS